MKHKSYKIGHSLEDITVFIYVAKFKSFVRAADFLELSRSIVSEKIAKLETLLGVTLFARTTRVVNLTNDGEIFFKYSQRLMMELDVFDNLMQKLHGISGVLKIAIPPYFSKYYIVPHLAEFMTLYPDLKLDVFLTEDPIDIITNGFDLQIRIQNPNDERLEVAKLMTNSKAVCTTQQYLKKHGVPIHPLDLLKHNCLIFGENEIWKFRNRATQEIIELKNIAGNIVCNNGEIIKELLFANIGITLKSTTDINEELRSGKVTQLFPEYEVMNETMFYVVYPKTHHIPQRVKAFIQFFQNKFEELMISSYVDNAV